MSTAPASPAPQKVTRNGLLGGLFAYFCWGLFPLYWRPLHELPALEILAHRIAWSLVFLAVMLVATRQWAWLVEVVRKPKVIALFAVSAGLLSLNWFLYIWAVNVGHVVEASLGYFINPLVNVVLGRMVLHERLRPVQLAAVGSALLGVVWLTWLTGSPPWISLVLAVSFGLYGLLRKVAPLASFEGLTLESILMGVPAVGYLVWLEVNGAGHFGHSGWRINSLLAGAGIVTALPLLSFARAARDLPLSILGVIQYVSPTLQFVIAVLVFREPFDPLKLIGFALIWAALISFSVEGLWRMRHSMTSRF